MTTITLKILPWDVQACKGGRHTTLVCYGATPEIARHLAESAGYSVTSLPSAYNPPPRNIQEGRAWRGAT